MIEFNCEHCSTHLSIAPDQMDGEIFCPACALEIHLPELDAEMAAKLAIAKAQAKNRIDEDSANTEKAVEMLQEPDSKETRVWKERLAESFQTFCFKDYEEPEGEEVSEQAPEKSGLKRIFNVFSKK